MSVFALELQFMMYKIFWSVLEHNLFEDHKNVEKRS